MLKSFSIISYKYLNSYKLPFPCWKRIFVSFIESAAAGIVFFLSVYFSSVLGIQIYAVGMILSSYGAGTIIGGILGGILSDKFSENIISIAGLGLMSLSIFLIILIKSMSFLVLDLFLLGLSSYLFVTANTIWVLNFCKKNTHAKQQSLSVLYVSSNLGLGFSALIIGFSSARIFHYIFLIACLLLLLAAYYLYRNRDEAPQYQFNEKNIDVVNDVSTKKKHAGWIVLGCLFLIGLVIAQLNTTYPIYIHHNFKWLGMMGIGILFSLNAALIVLLQAPITDLLQSFNKLLIVGLGSFFMGTSMLILNFPSSYIVVVVACVAYTFGEILFFSTAQLVCYESGIDKKKGRALGAFRTVYALTLVIGPTFGGVVYHKYGPHFLWGLSGLLGLICLMLCLVSLFRINTNTASNKWSI